MNFLMRSVVQPKPVHADTIDDKIESALSDIETKHGSEVCLRFSNTRSSKPKDLIKYGPLGALSLRLSDLKAADELPPLVKKSFKYIQVLQPKPKKVVDLAKLNTETKVIRLLQKIFEKQSIPFDDDKYATQKAFFKKKSIGPFGKGFINHPQQVFMTFIRYGKDGKLRDPLEQAQLLLTAGYDAIYDEKFGVLVKNQPFGYLFLRPQAFHIVDSVDLGTAAKPKKAPTKTTTTLDAESQEVLARYTPDLGGASVEFQKLKTWEEVQTALPKMSPDDIAWQITHGEFSGYVMNAQETKKHIGFRESSFMVLQNKKTSKDRKTALAEYMLDKAGSSFVGGPTLQSFIKALAVRGDIDSNIIKDIEKSKTEKDIIYEVITDPDELRKLDVEEFGYQLAKNQYTPADVLLKIADKDGPFKFSGLSLNYGGVIGDSATVNFTDAISHENFPIKELLKYYKLAKKKYPQKNALKYINKTMLDRPDLPKELREDIAASSPGFVWDEEMEKWTGKDEGRSIPYIPSQQAFEAYWAIKKKEDKGEEHGKYATALEYDLRNLVEHQFVTDKVLKEILNWENRDDNEGKPIWAITGAKSAAFKKLRMKGVISDKEAADDVRQKLKFDGPDDLLAHFGSHVYIGSGSNKLSFSLVSPGDIAKISKEMQDESVHEDFTFQVVAAYKIDKPLHKDFEKIAKKIQNVKSGLYHGTSCENAAGILANGVNVDAEVRTGAMFGAGFYLASASSKAVQYASDSFSKEGFGMVFKMNVALGKSVTWKYGRPEADEVRRNSRTKADQDRLTDYIKKNKLSEDFDTGWHMDYDSVHAQKGMALLHDEYVVKNGQQIQIEYVILVKKTAKES